MQADVVARTILVYLLLSLFLGGCMASGTTGQSSSSAICPVTDPMWAKPPQDAAVEGSPAFGHYYVNQDRSIWASAWWTGEEADYLRAGEAGIKIGWFRPAGATLEISGQRLDGDAPPLDAHVPCCYPTQFQATGLVFPTEGCWEISARAAERELSFVVRVAPSVS